MVRSTFEVHSLGDLILQSFHDPEDVFADAFKIERKEILYRGSHLLSINIFNDFDDYSISWSGLVSYVVFLDAATDIYQRVSQRAVKAGVSVLEEFTGSIFLPSESIEQKLTFPFDRPYFDSLANRGMTFLRLDMPYFDVWADLALPSGRQREVGGEIGLTSFYNIPEEVVTLFSQTSNEAKRVSQDESNLGRLSQLLSVALDRFRRL